jgi:hypothetical protein
MPYHNNIYYKAILTKNLSHLLDVCPVMISVHRNSKVVIIFIKNIDIEKIV